MRLELLSSGLQVPREAFRFGASTLEQVSTFNRSFWGQTGDVFFPKKSQKQFAKELEKFKPLHDAKIGFSAMEYGERKDDWEVVYFGGAMAVKAMVAAYEEPEIPGFVTRRIVDGIIDHHIIPAEQPLLSDDLVKRSEPPIKIYGKTVLELFPSIENRL